MFFEHQIGNWSRWLTDLFGMDDDDAREDEDDERQDASFKSFHLLLALSDLMMLPKDMLLSKSIRKEVELASMNLHTYMWHDSKLNNSYLQWCVFFF